MKENPLKQTMYTHLEVEKDDKLYTFSMPVDASLGEACDAAFIFFKAIDNTYTTTAGKEKKMFEEKKENEKVALKDAAGENNISK